MWLSLPLLCSKYHVTYVGREASLYIWVGFAIFAVIFQMGSLSSAS